MWLEEQITDGERDWLTGHQGRVTSVDRDKRGCGRMRLKILQAKFSRLTQCFDLWKRLGDRERPSFSSGLVVTDDGGMYQCVFFVYHL